MFALFNILKGLHEQHSNKRLDIFLVTECSEPVTGQESEVFPQSSTLIGLGRIIHREFMRVRCRAIDIDETCSAQLLLKCLAPTTDTYYMAVRNNSTYLQTFRHVNFSTKTRIRRFTVSPDGVYVITGGTGGLGLEFAQFLRNMADHGINVALLSRSGSVQTESNEGILRTLKDGGVNVELAAVDVSDPIAMRTTVQRLKSKYGRIIGIIHAAGKPGAHFAGRQSRESFEVVSRPKIEGTYNIYEIAKQEAVDFVFLYSSVATLFPAVGQGDYCAANSFLDKMTHRMRKEGVNALCVNWVAWKEVGMAFDLGSNVNTTFKAIPTQTAMWALRKAYEYDVPLCLIGELNTDSDVISSLSDYLIPLGDEVLDPRKASLEEPRFEFFRPEAGASESLSFNEVILEGRETGEYTECERQLAYAVCHILKYRSVNVHDDIYDLGADSLSIAAMVILCDEMFGLEINLYDYADCRSIAILAERLSCQNKDRAHDDTKKIVGIPTDEGALSVK
jgi:NAD(P)-dependent dehydrogenase (short-subunit alcohol dehydrogenase family)